MLKNLSTMAIIILFPVLSAYASNITNKIDDKSYTVTHSSDSQNKHLNVLHKSVDVNADNSENNLKNSLSVVRIGPYISMPMEFNDRDLVIKSPKFNTDAALLSLREKLLVNNNSAYPQLLLSGNLEVSAVYQNNNASVTYPTFGGETTNFNLSNAELDLVVLMPSPWVTGFFSLKYDDNSDGVVSRSRVLNSKLYLNNAFITVGNFLHSPFYASLGQIYIPFGKYASSFLSAPLTKNLGGTKARTILVGYKGQQSNRFSSSVYVFQGDSYVSNKVGINNGGINLGYVFNIPKLNVEGHLGSGWIANIADSDNMQYTGNSQGFGGFSIINGGHEQLVHRVPAINLRGQLIINDALNIITEYVYSTTRFDVQDLSFNGVGAQPSALHTEAFYLLNKFNYPISFGLMYDKSYNALALGMPAQRYGAVFNTSIWRNTMQSIEFRHDIHYSSNSFTNVGQSVVHGIGASDNVVSVSLDIYF